MADGSTKLKVGVRAMISTANVDEFKKRLFGRGGVGIDLVSLTPDPIPGRAVMHAWLWGPFNPLWHGREVVALCRKDPNFLDFQLYPTCYSDVEDAACDIITLLRGGAQPFVAFNKPVQITGPSNLHFNGDFGVQIESPVGLNPLAERDAIGRYFMVFDQSCREVADLARVIKTLSALKAKALAA